MDKFWEDQWSSQMEAWAAAAIHTQAKYNNMSQNFHSPSASESSFSVSTQDSPSMSAQSEASPDPGRYMLQSPDMSEERFHRIALFKPDTKFSRSLSMGSIKGEFTKLGMQQDWMRLQEGVHLASDLDAAAPLDVKLEAFEKAEERLAQSRIGLVHSTQCLSGTTCLSDGTESWASASSQELSWNYFCDGNDDLHPSISEETSEYCPAEVGNNFHDNNVGIRQGEKVWGTMEQEASDGHPFVVMKETDENTNRTSYAQAIQGIASCDESQLLHSRFDDICSATSASASSLPPSNIHTPKAQCDDARGSAVGLETRCFCAPEKLGPNSNFDLNLLSVSKTAYADCIVKDPPQMPQPRFLRAEREAKQLPGERDVFVSTLTNNGGSQITESASHNKPTHPKSRHSAAVEDKFSSSFLHGYFRFVEQDGSPCYSFSVIDSDEVFFARACKPESQSNRKNGNCLYTFHSRKEDGKVKGGWKSWLKKERLASSLVGKLEVADSRCIKGNLNRGKCIEETHFVLYGERCQQPVVREVSRFSTPTLGSHSQNVKQRDDGHLSMPNASASQGLIGFRLHEPVSRENSSKRGSGDVEAHRSRHSVGEQDRLLMELAAIAITATLKEHKVTENESERAGWGAIFLEKHLDTGWGLRFLQKSSDVGRLVKEEPQQHELNEPTQNTCESDTEKLQHRTDSAQTYPEPHPTLNAKLTRKPGSSKGKQPKRAVDVVVILPAGHHGLPANVGDGPVEDNDSYGPTSLLECWKSGGTCQCGGWDLGCGLSVLKAETLKLHKKRAPVALTSRDRINWISPGKPLQIFTQGNKRKKLLVLEIIQAGLFSLSFQARFSPLQAFATAVAIFHQQITQK